jgi:hypothetical protein
VTNLIEEQKTTIYGDVGGVLELIIEKQIITDICGFAKSNKPPGLLRYGLKWIKKVLEGVQSKDILSLKQVHCAVF